MKQPNEGEGLKPPDWWLREPQPPTSRCEFSNQEPGPSTTLRLREIKNQNPKPKDQRPKTNSHLSRESEAITRKTKDQKGRGEGVNGRRGDRETGRLEDKETGGRGDWGNQNPKPRTKDQRPKTNSHLSRESEAITRKTKDQKGRGEGEKG